MTLLVPPQLRRNLKFNPFETSDYVRGNLPAALMHFFVEVERTGGTQSLPITYS